jgi:hypothetical protein
LEIFLEAQRLRPWCVGAGGNKKEEIMRNLLMAAATGALLVAAVPASAQVYMGADPGGAGVQVGPFGFGVGPRYGYGGVGPRYGYGDEYYAYGADCPLVKERIVTADGRRIIRTHRSCRWRCTSGNKLAGKNEWSRKRSGATRCVKAKRAASAARFTVVIDATALCALTSRKPCAQKTDHSRPRLGAMAIFAKSKL